MRQYTLLALLGLLVHISLAVGLQAQSVDEVFRRMPDELIPLLPDSTLRAELLESPEGVSVVNHFGGEMSVKSRSEQGLSISLDRLTELEVGLLPHGKSYYICLIATSTIVPAQSVVTLFDADWKRMQGTPFTLPSPEHFISGPLSTRIKRSLAELGHLHWRATMDPMEPQLLTVRITSLDEKTSQSLYPEMYERVQPVAMKWMENHFDVVVKK